ncbi:hypothetical protein SLEP1_g28710 [Rubroshorea leprosula]|uniref:Uncharacterized protein n=1 Tax=Rubroshorea leprosula TaxID=152421 RepID=A0AAV5JUH7_9ROSI|nr:hypothetical protein SLEP1_g28710 [Rubroshorea leprosula]
MSFLLHLPPAFPQLQSGFLAAKFWKRNRGRGNHGK